MPQSLPSIVLPTDEQMVELPFMVTYHETREVFHSVLAQQVSDASTIHAVREWCDEQFQTDSEGRTILRSMWYSTFIGISDERFAHIFCFRDQRDATAFKIRWC